MDYTDAQEYTEKSRMSRIRLGLGCILTISLLAITSVGAETVQLKPDHPERYTVVKGDTLWDIAKRFLQSPWHWPKVWRINETIKNPHLIYPGDVIVLRWVDGKPELTVLRAEKAAPAEKEMLTEVPAAREEAAAPVPDGRTVKLQPKVHSAPIEAAIPTIPPSAITPFLTQPLAIGERELDAAGYITVGLDERIALGNQSEFYARGLKNDSEYYHIFRPGNAVRHPDTREILAYEAIYLGDARLLESGDPSKLIVTSVKQEILPTDRLLAASLKPSLPYYFPHSPSSQVNGRVVSALNAVEEIGPFSIVGVSLGARDGMEEGHVLRVMRHVGEHRDPLTRRDYRLPDEESGLLMVFRVFDKMSYALVMSATRPVHLHDAVTEAGTRASSNPSANTSQKFVPIP
jgi:LysM repeat protein